MAADTDNLLPYQPRSYPRFGDEGRYIYAELRQLGLTVDTIRAVLMAMEAHVAGYSQNGDAVTQATSRTTGVTIDAVCGAITLVSAAGSTTPATFTVTNSEVAATDTVVVSQKSGTDLYHLLVTNVTDGTFDITFFTTGGTTSEQPVFNFAIVRAVAA